MAESMTGYGRGTYRGGRYQVGVEIRSVNHRFLEIKLRVPRELNAFEHEVRGALRGRFSRGALEVGAHVERPGAAGRRFVVEEELLAQAAAGLDAAARRIGRAEPFDTAVLAQFREIFRFEEEPESEEELRGALLEALAGAAEALAESRRREGQAIMDAIGPPLRLLGDLRAAMEEAAPGVAAQLKEQLRGRAEELLAGARVAPERLEQEAALLALRSDITEELARFGGHLAAAGAALAAGGPAGRQLDFLLQEMQRELNTAAAKAGTLGLAQLAIRGKLELEKVREQVQNLE